MDYTNITQRFVNQGLNLRDDVDKVPQGEYTILQNISSAREGSFATRTGRTLLFNYGLPTGRVHTLKRLSSSFGLIGVDDKLYRNITQFSTTGYSGNPLSFVPFRPSLSTALWIYVGDENQLRKVRDDGSDFKWGITAPIVAGVQQLLSVAGSLNSAAPGAIVYDWRYTYYSSITGAESNPSPIVSGISVVSGQVDIGVIASADPQVDTIRIWRRGGVNGGDVWLLSGTGPNASANINDNNSDSAISLSLELELDNYVPFTSIDSGGSTLYEVPLPYAWGPFVGKYILACGDPNRPGHVYWTNAERPDSADIANNTPVTPPNETLLGGFIFSSTPFVFSTENLYVLDFGGPTAVPQFIPRRTSVGKGLNAPWAFCVGQLVYFLSKDGIYETDCQSPAVSLTETKLSPIFRGIASGGVNPIDFSQQADLRLFYVDNILHFFYKGLDTVRYHLTFHTLYRRWEQVVTSGWEELAIYQDEQPGPTVIFTGGNNGKLYLVGGTSDDGTLITAHVRTGSLDSEMAQTYKEYGNIIVDANPNGGVIQVIPYLDAEAVQEATQLLSGTGRQKLPLSLSDAYGYSFALDFVWQGSKNIYQYDLLWRPDEEAVTHWEFPETSHSLPGWQHLRDLYLAYRSTQPLDLTMIIDGVTYDYPAHFPSTSGARRKNHAFLRAVKGKVFRYIVNSSAPFRLYGEDCEVRLKSWNTSLGYSLISPFIKASGGT